jgi:very-short-patch-repair endonuclease
MSNLWQFHNYNPSLKTNARELRKNMTVSEVLLWQSLKNRQVLNYKFRRQVPILNYIVDFYCKELKLAVEIDGLSHDFKMDHDEERQKRLEGLGVSMFRVSDVEVKEDVGKVVELLVEKIGVVGGGECSPTPIPPKRGM